jgi:hypothetical protein
MMVRGCQRVSTLGQSRHFTAIRTAGSRHPDEPTLSRTIYGEIDGPVAKECNARERVSNTGQRFDSPGMRERVSISNATTEWGQIGSRVVVERLPSIDVTTIRQNRHLVSVAADPRKSAHRLRLLSREIGRVVMSGGSESF